MVVIRSGPELASQQAELQRLTEKTLIKHAVGDPLTEQDFQNLDKALPIIRGIIAFQPGRYTSHLVLGQVLLAQGERDRALTSMLQCLQLAPPPNAWTEDDRFIVAETLNDVGSIYFGKNDFPNAEKYVRESLTIFPDNVKYLTNMVQILIAVNRLPEAREALAKIKKINPKSEALAALEPLVKEKPTGSKPQDP